LFLRRINDVPISSKVQYAYNEMANGANNSRPTSVTYPNLRTINYNYGAGLDSNISRISGVADGATTVETYAYLGLGTVVKRAHPESTIDLTYIKLAAEATGDAGDK
jgi:hypothetical protein